MFFFLHFCACSRSAFRGQKMMYIASKKYRIQDYINCCHCCYPRCCTAAAPPSPPRRCCTHRQYCTAAHALATAPCRHRRRCCTARRCCCCCTARRCCCCCTARRCCCCCTERRCCCCCCCTARRRCCGRCTAWSVVDVDGRWSLVVVGHRHQWLSSSVVAVGALLSLPLSSLSPLVIGRSLWSAMVMTKNPNRSGHRRERGVHTHWKG